MKRLLTVVSLVAVTVGACRGQYADYSACVEDEGYGGNSATGGIAANAGKLSEGGAGGEVASGVGGAGGDSVVGSAGAGGSPLNCELAGELPAPGVHFSFDDCLTDSTVLTANINRPYPYLPEDSAGEAIQGDMNLAVDCTAGPVPNGDGPGLALHFHGGADERVWFKAHPAFDPEHDVTFAMWLKIDEPQLGDSGNGLLGRWYYNDQFSLGIKGTTAEFVAAYKSPRSATATSYRVARTLPLEEWVQLVIVVRRGEMLMYVNGEPGTATPLPRHFRFEPTVKELTIGQSHAAEWEETFKGYLDDLRIWKTALAPDEVALLQCPK